MRWSQILGFTKECSHDRVPIEQDYYVDGKAFQTSDPRPYRVCLSTGDVSTQSTDDIGIVAAAEELVDN